ncbi:BEL1-like homeodomain protein 7 [Dendrobium catenatum]|uniref:BEL1-like homeodomain protein 7 n=1 Tax=Dendrobium catenatum TaxID=906689 RepID=UPI0009F6201D|nr:BEL1-like homeodomain protein 7 [Dendrobium catenatum]XP_020697624.1 BEL1-like homeodomain protein 7 [Dendrobium catenatum]XP_020697625.1 BEL1-like homeodomain protein 7 [Dendrobium catenatum]
MRKMATFYPSSTNQRDVMGNLYLRDPTGHAMYPESAVNGNMVYLNISSGPYSETLAGSIQSEQNCIGFTDLVASQLGENAYNSWRDGRNEMLFLQANGESMAGDDSQMGLQSHLGILNEHNLSLQHSNISNVQGQGLSLSLGMQIPVPSFKYQPNQSDVAILSSHQSSSGNGEAYRNDDSRSRIQNINVPSYGLSNITSAIPNSKYLKTAQQLLDEVVNVQKALKKKTDCTQSFNTSGKQACKDNDGESKSGGSPTNHPGSTANSSSELSPSERQELQSKMTKLVAMLDEVDRRYKQYYHQMQIVVSSFDAIAGSGAAKPYTALALQTISRHFRSLRDAIGDQIRCTRKILGELDGSTGKGCGISRLRYIDQQIRQQRAIQQLGMMPQHAWRPQRGLPENSVTILRAWLFEHFLHPYPNDSEKLMLSKQTGLTRSQVSNWFINARVRLWKPMVEDMYKEEFGEAEMDSNSSSDNATKFRDEFHSTDTHEDQPSSASERIQAKLSNNESSPNIMAEINVACANPGFENELQDQRQQNSPYINLLHNAIHHSRFISYPMTELSRYANGVSLTLGLQHCDGNLQDSEDQQGFLPVRGEDIYNAAPLLGFGSSNLLHDYVA